MKNNKSELNFDDMQNLLSEMNFYSIMGGFLNPKNIKPRNKNLLGHDIELIPFVEADKQKICIRNKRFNNENNYGHLYKNGVKISNTIFRIGGLCDGFKDHDYCMLIQYPKHAEFGLHCIIDKEGKIVLSNDKMHSSNLHYIKGILAVYNDNIYNLKTGEIIIKRNSSSTLKSENYYFVENTYNKEYDLGVYKIEFTTGKCEYFK